MSFYSTPLGNLKYEHLKELIDDLAHENMRLEFKKERPDRDETLKKISSLANTIGGRIVVGMEADKESQAVALPGVDRDKSYEAQITSFCAHYLYPMLVPGISPAIEIPSSPGKVAYVIEIHESDLAPHFIEGRRGCYVRVNESSHKFEARLAESDELRSLFNRREEGRRRAIELANRSKERIARRAAVLKASLKEGKILPFMVRVAPTFPRRALLPTGSLRKAVQSAGLVVGDSQFPYERCDPHSQTDSMLYQKALWNNPATLLEVTTFGTATYAEFFATKKPFQMADLDREDEFIKGRPWIPMDQVLRATLVAVKFSVQYLKTLGVTGLVKITLSMQDVLGIVFMTEPSPDGGFFGPLGPGASHYDEVAEVSDECSTEDLQTSWPSLAQRLWRELYFSLGWPEAFSQEKQFIIDHDLDRALKSMSASSDFLK